MKDYKNIKTFDQLIEVEHGKIGTESRNSYEEKNHKCLLLVKCSKKLERKLK